MSASSPLSERELEILRLVATGLANKGIASALSIRPNTVKVHLRNIFEKIGVASRTEAAMYAVREGLVDGLSGAPVAEGVSPRIPPARPWWKSVWVWLGVGVALAMLAGAGIREGLRPVPGPTATVPGATASPAPTATPVSRWQVCAPMLTVRSGLAAVAYENQIYAVGGETDVSVTGALERYDPITDTWTALQPKPLPVADIGAAVVGGKIYVPGGRTAEGVPTEMVEVFDPRAGAWSLGPPLPVPLSAYALAAFEGKLYVFGGWDGTAYVKSVFVFDPDSGTWEEGTPSTVARGHAGAAAVGDGLFVFGGSDGGRALGSNLQYFTERDVSGDWPWMERAPMPRASASVSSASIADRVYVAGVTDGGAIEIQTYGQQQDEWRSIRADFVVIDQRLTIVPLGTHLFVLGQESPSQALVLAYQAVYSLLLPITP